ncbi:SpoIIE family protein phosphatase [Rhodococcus aetherivorans]|uniref:SpoIIE family protein phosphatase n=1 Tax=Rhodococcus aetherivorans TaxID=191292 RepID=UPI0036702284
MDDPTRGHPDDGAGRAARPAVPRTRTLPGYTVTVLHAGTAGGAAVDCYRIGGGAAFTVATALGSGLAATVAAAAVRMHLRAGARALQRVLSTPECGGLDTAAVVSAFAHLAQDFDYPETIVSLLHGVLDPRTGTIDYVHADHGPAVLVHPDGALESLPATRPPLGPIPGPWAVRRTALAPGARLLACSDSLLPLLGADDDRDAGVAFLTAHPHPDRWAAALAPLIARHPGHDDLVAVAVHRPRGPAPARGGPVRSRPAPRATVGAPAVSVSATCTPDPGGNPSSGSGRGRIRETGMAQGIVHWFDHTKGFGFLTPDGGGDEVFVEDTELPAGGAQALHDGARVDFEVAETPQGPTARNVRPR